MAKNTPKYERLYREARDVCGPPFPQFVEFFDNLRQEGCRVLDLGCGQGRDALFIARQGHYVLGVDLSETGISQMLEDAGREGLNVEGVVANIVEFEPDGQYDVILLDRVLHMLRDHDERIAVLERVCHHTKPGGFVLIADTPANEEALTRFFAEQNDRRDRRDRRDLWEQRAGSRGFLFFQRRRV